MTRISLLTATMLAACSLALAACSREADAPGGDLPAIEPTAEDISNATDNGMAAGQSFAFAGGDGSPLGSVMASAGADGLTLTIEAMGMPEGVHGIHLHDKGMCEGPKFESAGGHWNPAGKKHGRDNPAGAHLGDLDNLTIPASGAASTSFTVPGATMAGLADADGTALVVHAKADDYKTDPSGNSGDRIACAVIAPPLSG